MPKYIEREALIQDAEDVLTFQMLDRINRQPAADVAQVVRCGDCLYWQDRQVMLSDGSCRNYLPDEPDYVTASVGINMGAHCTKHGFEDESGSWFWANACDFCSRGERRTHNGA